MPCVPVLAMAAAVVVFDSPMLSMIALYGHLELYEIQAIRKCERDDCPLLYALEKKTQTLRLSISIPRSFVNVI
jgi:hypothetical protein